MAKAILHPGQDVLNSLPLAIVGEPYQRKIRRTTRPGEKRWFGRFSCPCGQEFDAELNAVRSGKRKSCGCKSSRLLAATMNKTHGMSKTRVYKIWAGMIKRCTDTKYKSYARYGGRGITVCERWRCSFVSFLEDVGEPPSDKHSLDRINNDGNYEPGNVRWATSKEQNRNTSQNRLITANGETKVMSAWAEELGIDKRILHLRLKNGWTEQEAVARPLRVVRKRKPLIPLKPAASEGGEG